MPFFPYFEFKPQQLPVMEFVFDVIGKKEIGLVEAYCGFGKTISTLAPVFEQGKKVLLLSPTHLARNAGIAEALRINKVNGKRLMVADLRSRAAMCGKFSKEEFKYEECRQARKFGGCNLFQATCSRKGFSPKAESALKEIEGIVFNEPERLFPDAEMLKEPVFFQEFERICRENGLCSYETMKELVKKADVVVMDYYWCFTEIFALLKMLINPKDFVLLVDEADLLVDRLYNSLHAKIGLFGVTGLLNQAKKILKEEKGLEEEEKTFNQADIGFLEEFEDYTAEILRAFPKDQALSPQKIISFFEKAYSQTSLKEGLDGTMGFDGIVENIERIVNAIDESGGNEKARARPQIFLKKLEQVKDSKQHLTFIPKEKNEVFIKPFEINNEILSSGLTALETLKEFHSAILFSATIGEEKLFKEEFGLEKETRVLKLTSLPHKGLLLLIDTELDSTYKKRTENAPKYFEKVKTMLKQDNSLLVSCCNGSETTQMLEAIPELENGEETQNFSSEKAYAINIRTKHARSTNKAGKVRNCIVIGLPLPDYSDFYFKQRKDFLEKKYGKEHAGKIINRKAIDIAIQLMGRITRDLNNPKTMVLADKRYKHDFFLHSFYYDSLPQYLQRYIKTAKNNEELEKELNEFWKGRR